MNIQLIKKLILQKINENVYLTEDRIPSLVTKYSGTKEVPIENIGAHHIVGGVKPQTKTIRKLSSEHDRDWTDGFGSVSALDQFKLSRDPQEASRQATAHIVNKIAEVDPTPSKEYTDKMLQWYMKSSDLPKGTGLSTRGYRSFDGRSPEDIMRSEIGHRYGNTLPGWNNPEKQEEYVQRGLRIHAQQKEAKQKEESEKHSSHPDYHFRSEDFGRAREALQIFHRVKHLLPAEHKDINKINSLHHLEDIVEPYKTYEPENAEDKKIISAGSDIIHEDNEVRVHLLKTQEASCMLGRGTRWCTAGRESNQFENYNSTSPLIVITDKKGALADRASNPRNRRFQFHFGSNRSATKIKSEEPVIGEEHEGGTTNHSLMDESDSDFDYHELVGRFPQLTKIPALQHLHATLFQEKPLSERRKEAATDAGFQKILKHVKDYAHMQRNPRTMSGYYTSEVNQHHDYLTSLLPKSNPNLGEFKQADVGENHPIMRHFFGDKNTRPTGATQQESKSFLRTMLARKVLPPSHAIESMFKNNAGIDNAADVSMLADHSDSPRTHELAYDKLQSMEIPHIHFDSRNTDHYGFLRKTTNTKLLERVHNDLKRSPVRDSSTTNSRYFNNTITHAHIAANPNTPTHVLEDIIRNKPMHGFHEEETGKEDKSIASINPITGTFHGSQQYNSNINSVRKDRAGIIALNNLLMREDAKKAKVKKL